MAWGCWGTGRTAPPRPASDRSAPEVRRGWRRPHRLRHHQGIAVVREGRTGPQDAAAVTWQQVCAFRLERHLLSQPATTEDPTHGVADVAAAICGAHAQILSAAELSLGTRTADTTRSDVQKALWQTHELVKTYGPRGTVHVVAARDLPMWTGALSGLPDTGSPMPKDVQLSADQTDAVVEAVAVALQDAELTMDELSRAVVDHAGPWAGELVMPAFNGWWPRWRQVMSTAANRGAVVFGAGRGRNVTFTSPASLLSGFRPADASAAVPELVRRYLRAYGPATPKGFAQWLNTSRPWAEELFASLSEELAPIELDGAPGWLLADDLPAVSGRPAGVRLLPYFDAYVLGAQPRPLVFPGRASARALSPSGQAGNFPVLLVNGTVAGVWHLRRSGRKAVITVELLDRLTARLRRQLEQQVERVSSFLDLAAELVLGEVKVGPHA